MTDRVGQQFGNYRLVSLLGQGGYAEVYLGQHMRLNLQAAIKVLYTHLTAQEVEHFQREAETIATLVHPSIVRVFDYDVQDDVPFLVMDYAPNGSLRQRYPKGSALSLPEVVSSVKQVATALQYAHERKFIHRDVKPENMLLGRDEEILLSDFGLAALAHSSGSLSTQEAVGTLAYMAPEQIEGYPRAASDQYALAIVVYEWLCGSRPFEGSLTEVMVQHLSMPPSPLRERVPTISPEVEQVVLRALAKDPKARFALVQDFAEALEQASQLASSPNVPLTDEAPSPVPIVAVALAANQAGASTETTPSADFPKGAFDVTLLPGSSSAVEINTPQSREAAPAPTAAALPAPLESTKPVQRRTGRLSGRSRVLLVSLALLVIAAGVLSSATLLTRFGIFGRGSGTITPVRGGTWIDEFNNDIDSLIPNTGFLAGSNTLVDNALYLPLFYGDDGTGIIYPGAATEVPSVQNGGISADARTWTFHLKSHLVWSDGQPFDARDVDYTWKFWADPRSGAAYTAGVNQIASADISADHLTITFHLKRAYVPFLQFWVNGFAAPLPAHHFGKMAPEAVLKSPDLLNPQVVSGPFLMKESVPGDHFTLVRNPRFYRAGEGLPYLDRVIFRIRDDQNIGLKDLQTGSITSAYQLDYSKLAEYWRLSNYVVTPAPTSSSFEALSINFHNIILSTHPEVRLAIASAIDHTALIAALPQGQGVPLCTDHGSFYHPGYQPEADCPIFDPVAANKLLDDNGWVRGADGVRAKQGQRLDFEYVTTLVYAPWRTPIESLIQRNLREIGIRLDIQYYPLRQIYALVIAGKASPPTGALTGRYDIVDSNQYLPGYDPDDYSVLGCNSFPPNGGNISFYCNPNLEALYKREQETADAGVRQQIFNQIHEIYLTDFPIIVLYGWIEFTIARKGTHNHKASALDGETTANIWEWWCDNGKC